MANTKIVRRPDRAEGGVTDEELVLMKEHTKGWIANALKTGRTDPEKLKEVIKGLYRVADLTEPIVVLVPSPKVMAVAGGIATGQYEMMADKENQADVEAAIIKALDHVEAKHNGDKLTLRREVMYAFRQACPDAPEAKPTKVTKKKPNENVEKLTQKFIACIKDWHKYYQGGNMWSAYDCYLTACRDILGLRLGPHEKYKWWEEAAKLGGFRYMHKDFCMVSDFPDVLNIDEQNRPHCEDGPSHKWSDGWSLWHIDGIVVDEQIVMAPESQTIEQIDGEENQDVRSIRIDRYGWANYLKNSKAECIDFRDNEIEGTKEALYTTKQGDKRLVATCATGRVFAMGVPSETKTCAAAQEWLAGSKKFRIVART